jgi:hypothetical protein
MKQSDPEFTKLLGNHMLNAKAFFDWGVGRGLTSPEALRLTVATRKEMAKQLVDGGMSKRKAAQALGVHHATIVRDTGGAKRTKNGATRTTRPEKIPTAEEADEAWQDDIFESACHYVNRMTSETRKRFMVHIRESYPNEI